MRQSAWRPVASFEGSGLPGWIAAADERLGARARRFRAGDGGRALVLAAPDAAESARPIADSQAQGPILFVHGADPDEIADLIELVGGGPGWLAGPAEEITDGSVSGGDMLRLGPDPVVEYRLRRYPDGPRAALRQGLDRVPRIGEGPDTLDDRAAWFEKRYGRG